MLDNVQFLVGLDPSFTRTGVCVIDLINKEIFFFTASCKIGEKQFENVVQAAQSVTKQIKDIIYSSYDVDKCAIVMEAPLPVSSMSSALYALDTLIYNTFESHIIKTYNPSTLCSKIHGHKYDKKDSQELTEKYLNKLSSCGYVIKSIFGTKKKIPHDCAEALLYAHLFLHDSGHCDFQFDNSEEIKAYKLRKKELKKKEKELLKQDPTYLS